GSGTGEAGRGGWGFSDSSRGSRRPPIAIEQTHTDLANCRIDFYNFALAFASRLPFSRFPLPASVFRLSLVNYATREITCKIVYYGPGRSGKTTNLHYIYGQVPEDRKGKMVSLATQTDRTLFFDFLPLDLG